MKAEPGRWMKMERRRGKIHRERWHASRTALCGYRLRYTVEHFGPMFARRCKRCAEIMAAAEVKR